MSENDNIEKGNVYDRIFKENAEAIFMPLLIDYLRLDIADYQPLPKDFPKTMEREVDYLFEIISSRGVKSILHLEFQAKSDKEMVYRMGVYHSLILEKYKLPVRHVVIYLGKYKTNMPSRLHDTEVFTDFELIKINELDAETLLSSQVPEVVILSLLSNYSEEQTERILRLVYRRLKDYEQKGGDISKYVRQFILLSRLRNLELDSYKIVDDMLIEYDIEKDYLYKKGILAGEAKGRQEGRQEGEERGIAKGRLLLAKAMKDNGEPLEKIILYTSLTKEEINKL